MISIRGLLTIIVSILALGLTSLASGHLTAQQNIAKKHYYHANGIVKWIGKNARFTQYSPDPEKKKHWNKAVRFYSQVRQNAWHTWHPKPKAVIDLNKWQPTLDCENRGSWIDGPGYFIGGPQFDPGTWKNAARHTGRWDYSAESQAINADYVGRDAILNHYPDPWPNCPDPYFG